MRAAHTPGPWVPYSGGAMTVWADKRRAICVMSGARKHPDPERDANARLIAAAPRLLEVCKIARTMIAAERQAFAECSAHHGLTPGDDPDNFVQIGGRIFSTEDAAVLVEYDTAIEAIDEAIAQAEGGAA